MSNGTSKEIYLISLDDTQGEIVGAQETEDISAVPGVTFNS